jgi:hypothetical protein
MRRPLAAQAAAAEVFQQCSQLTSTWTMLHQQHHDEPPLEEMHLFVGTIQTSTLVLHF